MKKTLSFLILVLFVAFGATAQVLEYDNIQLSKKYPQAGQQVKVLYQPAGTVLEGKDSLAATIIYWQDANMPEVLKKQPTAVKGRWQVTFKLPAKTKAYAISFSTEDTVDTNQGKGYLFPVYKKRQPVPGALGRMATIVTSGNQALGLKQDRKIARDLLLQELEKYPASKKDFRRTWYSILANSEATEDKVLLEKGLYALLQEDDEQAWIIARQFFYQLDKKDTSDSLQALILQKFPKGELVRDKEVNTIYEAEEAAEKEVTYLAWVKKYPQPAQAGSNIISYDYARNAIATAYAKENNVTKAMEYVNQVETDVWSGQSYYAVAMQFVKNDQYAPAKELLQRALNNALAYRTEKKYHEAAAFAASNYPYVVAAYADILVKEKMYEEALAYITILEKERTSPAVNATHANILLALGKEEEAFLKLEEIVKEGLATDQIKADHKALYTKIKGSAEGYNKHMASLQVKLSQKIKEEIAKKIISEPAPAFTLKDLEGNTVSLADFKGKTVILDFWATWCGPCIASFPAMQLAVDKYKDDPTVKFLFIDTWERVDDPETKVKEFIESKGYNFQVLMDLKDPVTKSNNVVTSYKIAGIPNKIIIDGAGNIRFKVIGFAGGNDSAVEEIAAMVEMLRASN